MAREVARGSLLYRGVRKLFGLSLELYFVEVDVRGRDNVPPRGPVVLTANHPNSVMDAVVLSTQTERPINFLGRSGLFRNRLLGRLLRSAGVLPVYRAQDGPTNVGGNQDAFRACFSLLEKGGVIGIFPEGGNAPERFVRQIKTGAARIALGAEARHEFELGVKVVPVGLNFEDRDRFFTRVLVRFGPPLDTRDWQSAYRDDPIAAVTSFTERIQEAMRREAVHVHDERHAELVSDIHAVYGGKMIEELAKEGRDKENLDRRIFDRLRAASGGPDLDDYFAVEQQIADAVVHFERTRPTLVETMRKRIRNYREHLRQTRLRLDLVDRDPAALRLRRESIKMTLYAILLAPIALWGAIHNLVPYAITSAVSRRVPDEATRAIAWLLTGLLFFPLTYTGFALLGWQVTHSLGWTALYLATMPFSGLWTLRYRHELARYNDRIVARTLLHTRRGMLTQLVRERRRILAVLEGARRQYLRTLAPPGC